jgi:CubicO group peptidase (beta-lactamase class C family)
MSVATVEAVAEVDLWLRVAEMVSRWPSAGLAAGVVRDGSLEWFLCHGVADVQSREPITDETVFWIDSITQTFTAIAVMQLWEQGVVDLYASARDYPRAFRLIPANASFRPVDAAHLHWLPGARPAVALTGQAG